MGFTLWSLLKASLLFVNALAILHEDRFLKPLGWGAPDPMLNDEQRGSVKNQVISLLAAVRWLRAPLIAINFVVIAFELLLG
mmetsp:Transcript_20932/g.67357  ORF Transcript_20932/g.67357 Transcript_20932/m.67357 type:complete len:82 (-) Transcript_20932:818-1063(-)